MLRSVLCYYSDTYIFVKGTAKVIGTGDIAGTSSAYLTGKNLWFKKCTSFTNCITEINNIQHDNTNNLDGMK